MFIKLKLLEGLRAQIYIDGQLVIDKNLELSNDDLLYLKPLSKRKDKQSIIGDLVTDWEDTVDLRAIKNWIEIKDFSTNQSTHSIRIVITTAADKIFALRQQPQPQGTFKIKIWQRKN